MHIAIEGMDGVGKTTIAKKLANKIGFFFVEKPLHYLFDKEDSVNYSDYLRISSQVNAFNDSTFRAWFYGLGNLYIKSRFNDINIVTDRHLVSNYFWNGTEENIGIFKMLVDHIGRPDYTFLLYASPEIRFLRIQNRDINDTDLDEVYLYQGAYNKMSNFLNKYKFKYEIIDTSNSNIDQTIDVLLETIYKEFPSLGR